MLGVSVGVIAIFCIAVGELVCGKVYFEDHRHYYSLALGLVGLGLWGFGRWKAARPAPAEEIPLEEGEERAVESYFLKSSQYWGVIVFVFGLVALFIHPLRQPPPQIVAAAPAPPRPNPPPVPLPVPLPVLLPEKLPAVAPIEFPKMKMQGVNTSGSHPNAIINGHVYSVGDKVGAAVVTAIDRHSVKLELSGQIKFLFLE